MELLNLLRFGGPLTTSQWSAFFMRPYPPDHHHRDSLYKESRSWWWCPFYKSDAYGMFSLLTFSGGAGALVEHYSRPFFFKNSPLTGFSPLRILGYSTISWMAVRRPSPADKRDEVTTERAVQPLPPILRGVDGFPEGNGRIPR